MSIRYLARITDDRNVQALALRAHAELFDKGHSDRNAINCIDEHAIVDYRGDAFNTPIGIIAFEEDKDESLYWIALSWVERTYRNQHIFKRLWDSLVQRAATHGIKRIRGGVAITNTTARETFKRLGRVETFVMSDYVVGSVHDVAARREAKDGSLGLYDRVTFERHA